MTDPVRVFIASSPDGDDADAELALCYSLIKNVSRDIELTIMRNNGKEGNFFAGFDNTAWATAFTNLRWAIPEYCNFEGRAIYMDVDMLNFRDIAELFDVDMDGAPLVCREGWRTCVSLFDCAKMKEILPPVEELRKDSSFTNRNAKALASWAKPIDPRWNCLDGEGQHPDNIWHLHFTSMPHQPWKPAWAAEYYAKQNLPFSPQEHPRKDLVARWHETVQAAKDAGFTL